MSTPNSQVYDQQSGVHDAAPLPTPDALQLSSMQWKGLNEVRAAEMQGREAVIADGVRDSLVALQLILPDMERHHRITERAKSLFELAAPESY